MIDFMDITYVQFLKIRRNLLITMSVTNLRKKLIIYFHSFRF